MDTTSTLPLPTGPSGPPGPAARRSATSSAPTEAPPNSPTDPTARPTAGPGSHQPGSTGGSRHRAGRLGRLLRGGDADPVWARPSLAALLGLTSLLYLWGLGKNGFANTFYSAAVQAGSVSWKAFFFGSSDAASSITVDKTPLSLWPMELAVRIFGLSSWSILVPEALMGVATVALLHGIVRRSTGSHAAGLLAGAAMALTPVAVLMFRFDNPDAALVLLMVAAAGATLRAVEETRRPGGHAVRWIALGGALVGLAFLAKMLQAFLVLPALALAYLLFAQTSWGKRVGHLLVAFGSMLLAGGWWIAIVELWPASSRPYIGGSQDNSILELALGYNGLGRLSGNETGSVGGGGGGAGGGWGATGVLRLLNSEIGGQIAWLMPAALVLGVAGLWFGRRRPTLGAGLVLWLTWLVVTAGTFSFMAGIFHAYYTVALSPAIAALVGTGAWLLWGHRRSMVASGLLSFTLALTAVLGWFLLDRTADFVPWLKWIVLVLGLVTALALAAVAFLPRTLALGVAGLAAVVSLAGPAAYAVDTVATAHTGSIVTAGPSTGAGSGPGGAGRATGTPPTGAQNGFGTPPTGTTGTAGGTGTTGTTGNRAGGMGGLLNGTTPSAALKTLLTTDADSYTWVAATVGANNASGYQLATGDSVMPIGGFNGSDPSPTLAQFKAYVANGQIHYFIASGGFGGGGNSGTSAQIAAWVEATFTAKTVGGTTVYDLERCEVSALAEPARGTAPGTATATVLDVVIPVFNEETQLAASVERVLAHLATLPWSFRVTVADNASTDQTALIARRLAHTHPEVEVVHLAEKGRGRALKRVWSASESDVLVYMDVDLSTDLAALLPLVAPLVSGHSDLAIGSRLTRSSRVERGARREIISRGYNLILRQALRARFSDAQCGFKAIRRAAARELLPLVRDDQWFFDTELLVVAERAGLRIHEVPVDWVDDPDSSVDLLRTALDDLKGVARLGTALVRGTLPLREVGVRLGRTSAEAGTGRLGLQVGVFLIIGIASTLAYALLFLALRGTTSPWWANFTALLVTAVLNTAANRRWTFGVRGPEGALRHQVQGLLVFAAGLGVTSGSLALLHASGHPGPAVEVTVLTAANLAVTALRFVAMRWWVFVQRSSADPAATRPGSPAAPPG